MYVKGDSAMDLYFKLNQITFTTESDSYSYRGYQKIDHSLICKMKEFGNFPITLKDLGYTKIKMGNLIKHYFCEVEKEKFFKQVEKAKRSKQASIYYQTIGESKGDHKKDHCIRGIGINIINNKIVNIHIFYRSSELSKKFLADLIFFNEYVFPQLNLPKDVPIYLHFVCSYVHAKQFPCYLQQVNQWKRGTIVATHEYWNDKKMLAMVVKNLYEVTDGKIPGFGMIRKTNSDFCTSLQNSIHLKSMVKSLKGVPAKIK